MENDRLEAYKTFINVICDNDNTRIITGFAFTGISILSGLIAYALLVVIPNNSI